MASELKVDKIFNAGGDQDSGINLATNDTIKFDIATSTKATMASTGIVTIVGEGGTNTTNLQQGLCKAWTSVNSNGTFSTHDSFNQSGATDNGTGDHTTTYTTSFSSAKGSPCLGHTSNVINTTTNIGAAARGGTMISQHQGLTQATGSYTFQVYYGSTAGSDGNVTDLDAVWVARLGDLA